MIFICFSIVFRPPRITPMGPEVGNPGARRSSLPPNPPLAKGLNKRYNSNQPKGGFPSPGERKNGKQRLFVCSCCECWAMCEETLRIWRHSGYASEAMLAPCCMTCRHSYAIMGMLAASWDHLCFCMQSHSYWFYFDLLQVPSARFARSCVEEMRA